MKLTRRMHWDVFCQEKNLLSLGFGGLFALPFYLMVRH